MLLSIDKARIGLSNFWLGAGGVNAMALAAVLAPLFIKNEIPGYQLLYVMAVVACIGLIAGCYYTFRAQCGSTTALVLFWYITFTMEFMLAGGGTALAAMIAGRPDLRGLAFFTNAFCITLTLLGGMYHEAKAIGWWRASTPDFWRKNIEKYIDYSTWKISPALTNRSTQNAGSIKSPFWIVAVGSANAPLLFEIYGGGKNNVIFLAAPLLTGTFAYLNLKEWGPGIVRLLLLRKLENSHGRRFINADLEQIQELRRTFFLSRWLMKDYAPPQPIMPAQKPVKRQQSRK